MLELPVESLALPVEWLRCTATQPCGSACWPWGPPADCREHGLHAVGQELKLGGSVLVSLWRWRHSEVIQLFSASVYLAIDSILGKTSVAVVLD